MDRSSRYKLCVCGHALTFSVGCICLRFLTLAFTVASGIAMWLMLSTSGDLIIPGSGFLP